MECPRCRGDRIAFSVPGSIRELIPECPETSSICAECLVLTPTETGDSNPDFDRIVQGFPSGTSGVAMVLATGFLTDSVALHRSELAALFDYVTSTGTDPWLVIERLEAAPTITPASDLERAHRQLDQLLST